MGFHYPRTRNPGPIGMCTDILYLRINHNFTADFVTFPNELRAYGLDERLLAEVFTQVQAQQEPS